jgi:AbrB family looped-hinge helix DNA binding protein
MKIGSNGEIKLPRNLRERFGFHPGEKVDVELSKEGILLKPMKSSREDLIQWLKTEHDTELATLRTNELMRLFHEMS